MKPQQPESRAWQGEEGNMSTSPNKWLMLDLGLLEYRKAWDLQIRLLNARKDGILKQDAALFLEHPPVFTLGRRGGLSNLKVPEEFLNSRAIPVVHVERGGDITYHGPGQLIIYPIVNLKEGRRGVVDFVGALEELMIQTLADWGIRGERNSLNRGVWVGLSKIGSIGIAVRRSISFHGLALNVNTDLDPFSWIHPCGLRGVTVTSMKKVLGRDIPMAEVKKRAALHLQEVFGVELEGSSMRQIDSRLTSPNQVPRQRFPKPPWLKRRIPSGATYQKVRRLLHSAHLHTVCQEACCPNLGECFSQGTATFLILGDRCTRTCRFCAVAHGPVEPLDPGEPSRVAEAVRTMKLRYVVVTSVTRDDLTDGGASVFAETIRKIREKSPGTKVEVLIPDFRGDRQALKAVLAGRPDVLNHNVETVPRLYGSVRPGADYQRSIELLKNAREIDPAIPTKSGLMLGLGERPDEVVQVLNDLLGAGCRILTSGQYLQPSAQHLPVERFVPPEEFEEWRKRALEMGFREVASGPFVRSSYHAQEAYESLCSAPNSNALR